MLLQRVMFLKQKDRVTNKLTGKKYTHLNSIPSDNKHGERESNDFVSIYTYSFR